MRQLILTEGQATEMLSELFGVAESRSVQWEGLTVYSLLELPALSSFHMLRVEFQRVSTDRREGLRIKVRGGELGFADLDTQDAVLWADTAPPESAVLIKPEGKGKVAVVRAWNVWETDGVMSSWIGNAGMLVESDGNDFTLRCSDGHGEVTFDDLVVRLTLRPVSENPTA